MRFIARSLPLLVFLSPTFTYAQTLPTFQHIIVLIQENRSPDNLFGSNTTFEPGVDLQQPSSGQWCLGACFDPDHRHIAWETLYDNGKMDGACNTQVSHGCGTPPGPTGITYCNGEIVNSQLDEPACPQKTYVSGTYDGGVVSPYFDIATKYGFANYFFQTNQGPSMPAHEFLFTGTSTPTGNPPPPPPNLSFFQAENPPGGVNNDDNNTGCTGPSNGTVQLIDQNGDEKSGSQYNVFPCFTHNSLPTLLDNASPQVTWKYYTNENQSSTNGIWNAPAAIYPICLPNGDSPVPRCLGSDYINDVVVNNPAQVLLDLGAISSQGCALRNVSWVIPNGDRSDHPGFEKGQNNSNQIEGGPAWVADIINAVGTSPCTDEVNKQNVPYWQDTAIFVVWDDWGGFWDHVAPYEVLINNPPTQNCDPTVTFGCGYVSGFRVPFLVVSAYTPAGYVSGDTRTQGEQPKYTHDFGSILAFIENNFKLGFINPCYQFADFNAPDRANSNTPLSDFFPISSNQPRQFQAITLPAGSPSATDFINYNGPILDPDNDVIDND
jgi:phospholipase C